MLVTALNSPSNSEDTVVGLGGRKTLEGLLGNGVLLLKEVIVSASIDNHRSAKNPLSYQPSHNPMHWSSIGRISRLRSAVRHRGGKKDIAYLRPILRQPAALTYQDAAGWTSLLSHGRARMKGASEYFMVEGIDDWRASASCKSVLGIMREMGNGLSCKTSGGARDVTWEHDDHSFDLNGGSGEQRDISREMADGESMQSRGGVGAESVGVFGGRQRVIVPGVPWAAGNRKSTVR